LLYIKEHDSLSRKICFKKVLDWIQDTAALYGYETAVVPDLPASPLSGDLTLPAPVIFSGLLTTEDITGVFPLGCLPVDTPERLQRARQTMRTLIVEHHIQNGVDIVDPFTTFIGPDVTIGKGTTLLPGVVIHGNVKIGEGCELGPFTHVRPDVTMGGNVRLGAFVEAKNSVFGENAQASHLTYIGDSDVGKRASFGCGSITVNYNGAKKFRTVIEDDAFIGCNTNLIAPVTVGKGAFTAAGSTITSDVPEKNLAIARKRQINKENWHRPEKTANNEQ